jgi:hypothetical protein
MVEETVPTRWRRMPEMDGARLAEIYETGVPLRAIADRVGLSYGSVHRRLLEAGVTMRPRGGARPR